MNFLHAIVGTHVETHMPPEMSGTYHQMEEVVHTREALPIPVRMR